MRDDDDDNRIETNSGDAIVSHRRPLSKQNGNNKNNPALGILLYPWAAITIKPLVVTLMGCTSCVK